jgi:hypothetical protein
VHHLAAASSPSAAFIEIGSQTTLRSIEEESVRHLQEHISPFTAEQGVAQSAISEQNGKRGVMRGGAA